MMTHKKTVDVTSQVLDLLAPLESEQRQRVIAAVMALLGEHVQAPSVTSKQPLGDANSEWPEELGRRARLWMTQNGISVDEFNSVFHLEGGKAEVIASAVPARSKKEGTVSAYLLSGVVGLLEIDEPKFHEPSAVSLCRQFGCYDPKHHAEHRGALGNQIAGTVGSGFTLPAPGLKGAAQLVKRIASELATPG